MIYRVSFRLNTKDLKHRQIVDHLQSMEPRSKEKKDFIINALSDRINTDYFERIDKIASGIMTKLEKAKETGPIEKRVVIDRERTLGFTKGSSRNSPHSNSIQEEVMDLDSLDIGDVMDKLTKRAFE